MQELLKQNKSLQQLAGKYYKQMIDLQETNNQHENEIDTLLKFNEKLLGIIQKQLNGQKLKNSDILSLHPISQKTQVQSQMFQSQFSNIGSMNPQLLLVKKSLNLKPDSPQQRLNYQSKLIPLKQQNMSIDVDGNDASQEDTQVQQLIKQFKKNIKQGNIEYTISQIQRKYKVQQEQLRNIKLEILEKTNGKLEKMSQLRNKVLRIQPKKQLIQMLNKLQSSKNTKNIFIDIIQTL